MNEFLSIKETRKLLGVTTPTLRRWAETGKVRFSETPTGRKLYNKQIKLLVRSYFIGSIGKLFSKPSPGLLLFLYSYSLPTNERH